MTGLHRVFDAATPPGTAPPGCQGVLGYIGGLRAARQWTLDDWLRFSHLKQYPCYVPDFTLETGQSAAVNAVGFMKALGWAPFFNPGRRVVVCDLETLTERAWYQQFAAHVMNAGFEAVAYGSLSTVLANAAADVWAAAWDGDAVLLPGQVIHGHQYSSTPAADYSVIDDWLWARGGQGPRHA
jgi:hypothetical protein